MASYNRVILVGNLTRDPELRYIPSGMAVTDVGLAVNDRRKTATGEWVDEVTFVDVTVWGRQAETVSEYLTKGSPVLFEGRLKLETWEKDGQKHSKLKVVCERMQMLGGRSGAGGPAQVAPAASDRKAVPVRPSAALAAVPNTISPVRRSTMTFHPRKCREAVAVAVAVAAATTFPSNKQTVLTANSGKYHGESKPQEDSEQAVAQVPQRWHRIAAGSGRRSPGQTG